MTQVLVCISTTFVSSLPATAELIQSIRTRLEDRAPELYLADLPTDFPKFVEDIGSVEVILDLRQAQ